MSRETPVPKPKRMPYLMLCLFSSSSVKQINDNTDDAKKCAVTSIKIGSKISMFNISALFSFYKW